MNKTNITTKLFELSYKIKIDLNNIYYYPYTIKCIRINHSIKTVRFTNKTYTENLEWRTRKNHKGCIYGLDTKITDSVNKGEYIFVMEMNNDKIKLWVLDLLKM